MTDTPAPAPDPGPVGEPEADTPVPRRTGRRALLAGALGVGALGGAAAALGGAAALRTEEDRSPAPTTPPAGPEPVDPTGPYQAGITRPATPQSFGLVSVLDLPEDTDPGVLADLGAAILALTTGGPTPLLPDGPQDLTVTVGVGPRWQRRHHPGEVGGEDLPSFDSDGDLDPGSVGGDLLLAVYSGDPTVLGPVTDHLRTLVPGQTLRWSQRCFRGKGEGTIVRSPLGFHDGIEVPHTEAELAENVWLTSPLGATICVIRRLRLDLATFGALPPADREAVIGRTLDGAPLSGGDPFSEVNVSARTPAGVHLIPDRAHVRAAHPSFTGSPLMLRRSYGYDNGGDDHGLVFVCFQRELRGFVLTQRRLDETDALMDYATPTASATFLILPGFSAERPLGSG